MEMWGGGSERRPCRGRCQPLIISSEWISSRPPPRQHGGGAASTCASGLPPGRHSR